MDSSDSFKVFVELYHLGDISFYMILILLGFEIVQFICLYYISISNNNPAQLAQSSIFRVQAFLVEMCPCRQQQGKKDREKEQC